MNSLPFLESCCHCPYVAAQPAVRGIVVVTAVPIHRDLRRAGRHRQGVNGQAHGPGAGLGELRQDGRDQAALGHRQGDAGELWQSQYYRACAVGFTKPKPL